jgi:multisubunit Na+/H+ antiporter MnhC subunit
MFVLLGVVFIAYEGTSALSGLYEAYGAVDLAYTAERWVSSFANSVPDALVLTSVFAAILVLASIVLARRRRKRRGFIGTSDSVEEFTDENNLTERNVR